jgi:hypothetical protein
MLKELSMTSSSSFSLFMLRGRAVDERIRERQRSRSSSSARSDKQQQVAQAAVLDRALRAPLEKHQRAERARVVVWRRSKWT